MSKPEQLITEHIDIWTSAILAKSTAGRGSSKKHQLYGIKKLRELILELAVRGKLLPQNPNDEPASVLLEKVADEKSRLVKEGQLKKSKPLPRISDDEKIFELPKGWEASRLGDIVEIVRGVTFPGSEKSKNPEPGRIACLRTSNVQHEIEWDDLLYIRPSFVNRDDQYIFKNDIVMSMANSRELVGKVALIKNEPKTKTSFGGFLSVIRPYLILPSYLMILLRSPTSRESIIGAASQTTNIANISLAKLNPHIVCIPPLAEQHRIVAKVDELMLLCDQLEQQTEASIDAHATLAEVLLATLTDSADANELAQNWARVSEYFDSLFTTKQSIEALKQTVLQLAVMGKLVPQNTADEPATVLLENIAKEKNQLIKDKKIKKQKLLPPITDEEKPFELPDGWEWCCLGTLTTIRGGKRLPKGQQLTTKKTPYIYIRVTDMRNGSIREDDIHYISEEIQSKISNYIITQEDIYMTIVGATIGKCGLVPYKFDGMNLTENAARITPFYGVEKNYLFKCLDSSFAQKQFFDKTKQVGVQKMALNRLSSTKIPFPPLAEQHRIVAKVDELMTICDQLKDQLQESQVTQIQLTDALTEKALA